MIRQKMFTEEERIRRVLGNLRGAILSEQERYRAYSYKKPAAVKLLEDWRGRITVYTETSNLMTDYLTDFTVSQHGALKYLRQAEEEVKVAKASLLYMDQLHAKKAKRDAVEMAEKLAYSLMGEVVDQLEPQLRKAWAGAVEEELALYEKMVHERRDDHA